MSSAKTKNLIIIMLVLLNAILLGIVLFDKHEDSRARQAEAEAIGQVLSLNGIELGENVDFRMEAPVPCLLKRDPQAERELIEKMIGSCSVSDLGGNILFYEAESGQAMFRGNGELDVVFGSGGADLGSSDGKAAAKFMGRSGLELYPASQQYEDGDLIVCCGLDGYCVYNAKLVFTLNDDRLMMINGTRIFDGSRSDSAENVMDSITAMMRFIEIVHDEGYICSRISGLEAGYVMSVSVSGECSLSPVWRVITDTGELYINAVSGKLETLPA